MEKNENGKFGKMTNCKMEKKWENGKKWETVWYHMVP